MRTDIIGYPIFEGWDHTWYQSVYRRWVFVFPLVAWLTYVLLGRTSWFAATRRPRVATATPVFVEVDSPSRSGFFQRLSLATRVTITGAAIGFEFAVVRGVGSVVLQATLVTLAFAVFVAATTWGIGRLALLPGWGRWERLAAVSAVATLLPVVGLYGVSRRTELLVVATGERVEYEWLPALLVIGVAAGALGFFTARFMRLRRTADPAPLVFALERAAVLYLSGGVIVFLLVASLPGSVGPLDAFHEGESLAAVTTLRAGQLPWRDSLGIHGLLGDYIQPLVGIGAFGDTRWAVLAGHVMLLYPLCWVGMWWLMVRFTGRAWPVLVIGGTLMTLGSPFVHLPVSLFGFPQIRFLLQPILLLIAAACFARRSRRLAFATGVVAAIQFIVTPESGYMVAALGVTLVTYEWFGRARQQSLRSSFVLTAWAAVGSIATMMPFLGVLAVGEMLDDYINYFRTFARGHTRHGEPSDPVGDGHVEHLLARPDARCVLGVHRVGVGAAVDPAGATGGLADVCRRCLHPGLLPEQVPRAAGRGSPPATRRERQRCYRSTSSLSWLSACGAGANGCSMVDGSGCAVTRGRRRADDRARRCRQSCSSSGQGLTVADSPRGCHASFNTETWVLI